MSSGQHQQRQAIAPEQVAHLLADEDPRSCSRPKDRQGKTQFPAEMLHHYRSCIALVGNKLAWEVFLFGRTVLELTRMSTQLTTTSRCCKVWFKLVNDIASRQDWGSSLLATRVKANEKSYSAPIYENESIELQQSRLFFNFSVINICDWKLSFANGTESFAIRLLDWWSGPGWWISFAFVKTLLDTNTYHPGPVHPSSFKASSL